MCVLIKYTMFYWLMIAGKHKLKLYIGIGGYGMYLCKVSLW